MAEMVPTEFWKYAIGVVKKQYPNVDIIGEVYEPSLYRDYLSAGFDYLYDKVGMYDCLRNVICGLNPASDITQRWQWTDDIQDHMLYFLENHDEQRIASDFFASDPFKAVPALAVTALFGRNPVMIYSGQEYGERAMEQEGFSGHDGRTTIFDYWSVESICRGFFSRDDLTTDEQRLEMTYKDILNIARSEKAVSEGKVFDLMYVNQHLWSKQFAFLRKAKKEMLIVVANFSSNSVNLPLIIPSHAFEYLSIKEGICDAVNLIGNAHTKLCLIKDTSIHIDILPNNVLIYKIVF